MSREGWQPIETAPRDGTWILVYRAGRQYVARWADEWRTWAVSASRMPGERDEAFTSIGQVEISGRIFAEGPSHWMPLPEAPDAE